MSAPANPPNASGQRDALHVVGFAPLRPRYVSPADARSYLALGETKLHELLNQGRLRAKKDGERRLLIEVASMDEYLDALPDAERKKK